jgi:hypothetical protein
MGYDIERERDEVTKKRERGKEKERKTEREFLVKRSSLDTRATLRSISLLPRFSAFCFLLSAFFSAVALHCLRASWCADASSDQMSPTTMACPNAMSTCDSDTKCDQ